jgi:hypothetical protein
LVFAALVRPQGAVDQHDSLWLPLTAKERTNDVDHGKKCLHPSQYAELKVLLSLVRQSHSIRFII